MARNTKCIVIGFLLLLTSFCNEITKKPRNTLVLLGEREVLECCSRNTNATFTWRKYVDGLPKKICERGNCPEDKNYKIDKAVPGCENLAIVSASGNDSARYECSDGTDKAAAYLIAGDCGTNISREYDLVAGDVVTFRCHVVWNGKPPVRLSWINEYGNVVQFQDFTDKQDQYLSKWTVSLQPPELQAYTFVVEFQVVQDADDRIDRSSPRWTSKKLPVAYPMTHVQTSCQSNRCVKKVGEWITCFAQGYPSPEFSWLDENDKEVSRGPVLNLIYPETQKYKCVATNFIRGIPHKVSVLVEVFVGVVEEPANFDTVFSQIRYIVYVVTTFFVFYMLLKWKKIISCVQKIASKIQIRICGRQNQSDQNDVEKGNRKDSLDRKNGHEEIELEEIETLFIPKQKIGGVRPDDDDDDKNEIEADSSKDENAYQEDGQRGVQPLD